MAHSYRYREYLVECNVGPYLHAGVLPQAVTLIQDSTNNTIRQTVDFLPICHLVDKPDSTAQVNFAVCSSGPLHYNFSDVNRLVEWIEVNSLFGAEQFVLYNHSGNWRILQPYVDYYSKLGRLQVVQWDLKEAGILNEDVFYFAQVLHENDCLLRTRLQARYVAFLDVDECMVPRGNYSSWVDIISSSASTCSEYHFRNVFFNTQLPNDDVKAKDDIIRRLSLATMLKTKASKQILPAYARSKFIAKSSVVRLVSVHYVLDRQNASTGRPCVLSPSQGLLHHYRKRKEDSRVFLTLDRFMLKHRSVIVERVSRVHRLVGTY